LVSFVGAENLFSVRVWDLPTRLCHGALALLFIALMLSGQIGGDLMVWHMRCGYAMLSLVIWRILWGFIGGYWSRFSSFMSTPLQAWQFARRPLAQTVRLAGHNPLGAWSVLAMLCCLGLQAVAGLFSDDQISTSGPLTALVSEAWVERATQWHTGPGKWAVLALVVLHLSSIYWYQRVRKIELLKPMLTGDQVLDSPAQESKDSTASRFLAAVLFLLCTMAVGVLVTNSAP
jgi:cytochrome b